MRGAQDGPTATRLVSGVQASKRPWLRDAPIASKLNAIVVIFVASLLIFSGVVAVALELSESTRAYVHAEGLWSKGQKNAVIALTRYLHTGGEADYRKYLEAVSIPLDLRRSRLALEKAPPDLASADHYLMQGGVRSSEARGDMIRLFRCCSEIGPFGDAVEVWREGDEWIAQLVAQAERAHARISAGKDHAHVETEADIEAINDRLTVLEREFSSIIGDAAETVHQVSLWVTFLSAVGLLAISLLLAKQISRQLASGMANLNEGVRRMYRGDLNHRIEAQSRDELGRLAEAFNDMVAHRREAAATLEQQRAFLEATLESMTDGVVACDAKGRLVLFNRAAREFHGLDAAPVPPDQWSQHYSLYLPDGTTPVPVEQLPLLRALHGEVVQGMEIIIGPRGKQRYAVVCSGRRLTAASGEVLGAVVALRDVTQRKHAEERFRLMVETAPNAMVMVDARGRITLVNAQLESLLGYGRDEIMGQPVEILLPWESREKHPALRAQFLGNPEARPMGRGRDLYALSKDRHLIPVEIGLSPIHMPEGVSIMAAIIDVSERKSAEDQLRSHVRALERASDDLSQFAFSAAHHLQEPLRTVMSYTQLLAKEYAAVKGSSASEYVGFVNEAVLRMRDLIEGLRAYTHVTLHEHKFERADLNRLFGHALDHVRGEITTSQARITHDPLPTLVVNPPLITELFQHLIGNALKFRGPTPPEIHVGETPGEQAEWHFSVRDNGIGIEPKRAEQVFELFERLHTRDDYPGIGVGLSLCRRIVERHGGRIWVEPGNPGSIFHFTLSLEPIAALHKDQ